MQDLKDILPKEHPINELQTSFLQFVHEIKVKCNASIELKQTLELLNSIVDQETPS